MISNPVFIHFLCDIDENSWIWMTGFLLRGVAGTDANNPLRIIVVPRVFHNQVKQNPTNNVDKAPPKRLLSEIRMENSF